MRAHEKMLLNSKLMKARPYLRHFEPGSGCALGMMEDPNIDHLNYASNSQHAEIIYPWLTYGVDAPCDCGDYSLIDSERASNGKTQIKAVIAHLFNEHVCQGGRCIGGVLPEPWTIERLADYIKSIDPTVDQDEEILCESEVPIDQEKISA